MILATVMRDAHRYLGTWTRQVEKLHAVLPLRVIVAEGDSDDETYKELLALQETWQVPLTVLKVEHGGPYFGSVDDLTRWRQLGAVCNVVLTAAVRELGPDEPLVYCESDLLWDALTMEKLVKHTELYPAVVPMSMFNGRFYDVWGYRIRGEQFRFHAPYFDGWSDQMMHQIDSSGSCFALSHTAAQFAHFGHDDCVLGIGRTIRVSGLSLWLDPTLEVTHP